MIIYKVFQCSRCKKILELQYDETKEAYIGSCTTCNRKIETSSFRDEESIKKKYGR